MKIAAVVVLSACIAGAGCLYCSELKAKMRQIEYFLAFLSFAKSEVSFSGISVLEIVRKYTLLYPKQLPFLEGCREPVSEHVRASLKDNKALNEHQKQSVTAFFDLFGRGDEQASIRLIAHTIDVFDTEYRQISVQTLERIKLVRRLSFLAAAAAAIMFI
ncbi:MAG: hypothetical protein IKE65_00235 [Clostridia bacterium]|nr:hypothetical protein [Clostridia bacterium]